ncbi:uncharacterized protein AMSG_11643 [Thecamonas trahens ATCC 50062]|uniref:Uncharacterized protein n=1 Tax=Thecamonas trahens ATCC 50062 TaxID=461836 RepID=A0A0L0DQ42_THETB|nr:hypothetical protein AMSG_11643 [Thecamonas trahens ATCC 50062]KNC53543.1 hypothetical protein AMSG_11643 [Thecamonas trahens ATCC 50062]|eukprot:XP_013762042.1 hypothetical protein AMSG_11643 [Thecamonas trahens ATCC 50062]
MVLLTVEVHGEDGAVKEAKRVFLLDTKPLAASMAKAKFLDKVGIASPDGYTVFYRPVDCSAGEDELVIEALDDVTPFTLKLKKSHVLVLRHGSPPSLPAAASTDDAGGEDNAGDGTGAGGEAEVDPGADDARSDGGAVQAEAATDGEPGADEASTEVAAAAAAEDATTAAVRSADAPAAPIEPDGDGDAVAAAAAETAAAKAETEAAEATAAEAEATAAAEVAAAEAAAAEAAAAEAAAAEAAAAEAAAAERARIPIVASSSDDDDMVTGTTRLGASAYRNTQHLESYSYDSDSEVSYRAGVRRTSRPPLGLPANFDSMTEAEQMMHVVVLETVCEVAEVDAQYIMAAQLQSMALSQMDAWGAGGGRGGTSEPTDTRYSAHVRQVIHEFDAFVSTTTRLMDQIDAAAKAAAESKKARYVRKKQRRARTSSAARTMVASPKATSPGRRK